MFGKLLSTVVEAAKLPVDVVADVVTGCGIATSDDASMNSYTKKRAEKIQGKLESMDD